MSGTDVTWPDLGGRGDGSGAPGAAPDAGGRRATRRHQAGRQPSRGGGVVLGAVGVLGELLITAGVLLLAFLAWQLWWTDVEANREQAALVQEQGWDRPLEALQASDGPAIVTPRYDEPPVMDEPEYLTTFASMRIPRWDGEPTRTITQGTDRPNVLNPLGVGHYEGTAMPGGVGNFSLAAHRTTYGKPFNRIAELQEGDPVVVWTEDTWYVYRVTSSQIVMPDDVQVIAPVPDQPGVEPTERMITLTTCHPMFSARERYIVHGVLDYWAPVSEGVPAELAEVP
ncbi:class E sortase [Cellulomonas pakistanensis]|uniref:Class E sortase n=1 Tax=Cellulomonas pakistanensis TaxID=992287 RepID=A0A919U262_9CELL|nr:class E sortase [Cellulomonas pakistanensis]GIG34811.1 class E sortase [Cellulomonas pakistanensis]